MSNSKTFLTNYIMSLKERTRNESVKTKKDSKKIDNKSITKYGFDWIIYNLGQSKGWSPVELPFFRNSDVKEFKAKTGAQYGVDISFYYRKELIIFVLKDERLNNSNWHQNDFESDIRNASSPNLEGLKELSINRIKIILAYNKDEDNTGIQLYENLVSNLPSKIRDGLKVKYERWNLTRIVKEVNSSLLTPELLPQNVSSILSYICSLYKDIEFGTEEWEKIMVPNWKNFLQVLFAEEVDEKRLRMIPVSIYIIYNYRDEDKSAAYTGWIDLIEWALLSVLSKTDGKMDDKLRFIVFSELWHSLYLYELEKYLIANHKIFIVENSIISKGRVGHLAPLNDAYLCYWVIGRIGILHLGFVEIFDPSEFSNNKLIKKLLDRSVDWLKNLIHNNPSAYRPLIDVNHIELYLIWLIFYQNSDNKFLYEWFSELESRLVVRRLGNHKIPFIEGRNRLDLVAEYAATNSITGEKPYGFVDNSSYLLMMLLELMFSLDDGSRDDLLDSYFKHIVLGLGDDDQELSSPHYEVELQSWYPPENWSERIYDRKVTDGTAISTQNFAMSMEIPLAERIQKFIAWSEMNFPPKITFINPLSTYILACIKNNSPLPPAFWRGSIFKPEPSKVKDETK